MNKAQGKRRMLHITRNPKEKLTDESFFRLIFSAVMGILLCCICLASLTWAWFSTSVQSPSNKIESAEFYVTAVVSSNGQAVASTPVENDIYTLKYALEADKSYTVKLTAHGSASNFGGYCEIILCGADGSNAITRHTVQLYPSQEAATTAAAKSTTATEGKISEITFTVNTSDLRNILTIRPTWGNYLSTTTTAATSGTSETTMHPEELITSDSVIGVPIVQGTTEEQVQTTQALTNVETTVQSQVTTTVAATEGTLPETTVKNEEQTEATIAQTTAENATVPE